MQILSVLPVMVTAAITTRTCPRILKGFHHSASFGRGGPTLLNLPNPEGIQSEPAISVKCRPQNTLATHRADSHFRDIDQAEHAKGGSATGNETPNRTVRERGRPHGSPCGSKKAVWLPKRAKRQPPKPISSPRKASATHFMCIGK